MNDTNPYAPPAVAEAEDMTAYSGAGWKIYGTTLIVLKGTTLPKIDLETGSCDPSLKPVRKSATRWGGGSEGISIFTNLRRARLAKFRSILREVTFFAIWPLIVFAPTYERIIPPFITSNTLVWVFVLIVAHTIWSSLDRPKLNIESAANPGWIRVTPIHPEAVAFLRQLAVKQTQVSTTRP